MKVISEKDQNNVEVSMKDQMKKFLIKSLYGFLTVLMFGLGRRTGILDYLLVKAKKQSNTDTISSITFTIEEISENLNLERNYVDAWAHTALECGILEIDDSCERCLRTAPYVYELLINRNQPAYIGDPLGAFYYLAPYQELILDAFKKEGVVPNFEFTDEVIHDINRMSARFGTLIERIFSNNYKDFCEQLHNGGIVLAAGSGYGYNLQIWAKKYNKTRFVGIDIDPEATSFAKKMVEENNWNDRIEIYKIQINDYARETGIKFDLILLNQVLHEMDHDLNYRLSVFNSLYSLLKEDGQAIILNTDEALKSINVPNVSTKKKDGNIMVYIIPNDAA